MKVTVLMSTYNGQMYLEEQLDSILLQSGVRVNLVVRDDCSSDLTLKILSEYKEKYPGKIEIINGNKNLGACKSFLYLISRSYSTDYFALADQDDIWDKDKLSYAIKCLKKIEAKEKNLPLLYYSNLRIVDYQGNFLRNSHDKPHVEGNSYSFLADPLPTGCTIVYNRGLYNIVSKYIPNDFSMHDVWLYTTCRLFGKVYYDFIPHICYRQHGNNVIGAYEDRKSFEAVKNVLNNIFDADHQPRLNNAFILYNQYYQIISQEQKAKLLKIINYKKSFFDTVKLAFDNDFNSEDLCRTIVFKIKVILRTI